jgi:predicted phosphodiesterase
MKEMPILKEDSFYFVSGNEDFSKIMGFGIENSKIEMMNLMMVEGSGYEKMEHH